MKLALLALLVLAPGKRPLVVPCAAAGDQFAWGELPQDLDTVEADYHEHPQTIAGDRFRVRIARPLLEQASWDERFEAVVCRAAKPAPLKARARPAPLTIPERPIPDEYTVLFRTAPRLVYQVIEDMSARYGVALERIVHIIPGATCSFAGKLSSKQVTQIRADARVEYVAQDEAISAD